jgi:hypothetical protein
LLPPREQTFEPSSADARAASALLHAERDRVTRLALTRGICRMTARPTRGGAIFVTLLDNPRPGSV